MVFGLGKKSEEVEEIPAEAPREQMLLRHYQALARRYAESQKELERLRVHTEVPHIEVEGEKGVVTTVKEKLFKMEAKREYCVVKPSRTRGKIEGSTFRVCQPHLLLSSFGFKLAEEVPYRLDIEAIKGEPHIVPIHRFNSRGQLTGELMPLFPNIRDDHYRIVWEPSMEWGRFVAGAGLAYDEEEKIARIPVPLGESRSIGNIVLPHRVSGVALPRLESIVGASALMKSIGLYNYDLTMLALDVNVISALLHESYALERAMRHIGMRRIRETEQRTEDMFKIMQRVFLAQALMGTRGRPTVADVESGGEYALSEAAKISESLLGGEKPRKPVLPAAP